MRETITKQCYPDDYQVNKQITEMEAFGWELISNQRCQEVHGDNIETFNKLTFSREKNSPWYSKITSLERQYITTKLSIPDDIEYKRFNILIFLWLCFIPPLSIIYAVVKFKQKSEYKANREKISVERPKAEKRMREIIYEASRILQDA